MKIIDRIVKTIGGYIEIIGDYPSAEYFYRGHADIKWKLTPSIGRIFDDIPISSPKQDIMWSTLEHNFLSRFKRLAVPYLKEIPKKEIDWIVIGQHYGLPTRLLDLTENPLVALFFALIEDKGCDSVVWIIQPSQWFSMDCPIDDIFEISFFFPQSTDKRVVSQKGCFTIHPLPHDDSFMSIDEHFLLGTTSINELIRIKIPNDKKIKIKMLIKLYELGINHNFIYPELEGLTEQLKFEFKYNMIKR